MGNMNQERKKNVRFNPHQKNPVCSGKTALISWDSVVSFDPNEKISVVAFCSQVHTNMFSDEEEEKKKGNVLSSPPRIQMIPRSFYERKWIRPN